MSISRQFWEVLYMRRRYSQILFTPKLINIYTPSDKVKIGKTSGHRDAQLLQKKDIEDPCR